MCIILSTKNIEMVIYSQYYLLFVKFLENISLFQEILNKSFSQFESNI